jgi:thiol-disulfide isomerase/thioredoxin
MFGRLLITVMISMFFYSSLPAQSNLSATEILSKAQSQAVQENKKVFVLFHASWCGWCHKMDTPMNEPSLRSLFNSNYVIVHMVVYEMKEKKHLETNGALELLTKYKGNDLGIPFWIIFDSSGKWLADSREGSGNGEMGAGENVGCPAQANEVAHFIKVLEQTSSLNKVELALIEKRFRENVGN